MASKGRTRLHQVRKQVTQRIERLWPSTPLVEVAQTLVEAHRGFIGEPEAEPAIPAHARAIYDGWIEADNADLIRRYTVPVTVDPAMGIVFAKGRIVWGSSDFPERERAPRFFAHLLAPQRRLPRALLLHHVHGYNFFHFFDFVAQKAWRAETYGIDPAIPVILPWHTARMPFVRQAIDMGLFAPREVIVQGPREVIGVDEAWTISTFDCLKPAFDWAARRLSATITPEPEAVVMLVRGKGALNARPYRNQEEINAIAQARGVVLYDPAEHALAEQIARFSSARAIIGAHGAGLTNMMFRQGPCSIFEIFNPDHATPHYYIMARQRGFDYRYMLTRDPIGKSSVSSTHVPVEDFTAGLDALLSSLAP